MSSEQNDENRQEKYSPETIRWVQQQIEECLKNYMTKLECIQKIHNSYPNIEPGFINLMWERLEQLNPEFFRAFRFRARIKKQVQHFNEIVNYQMTMMVSSGFMLMNGGRTTSNPKGFPRPEDLMQQQQQQHGMMMPYPMYMPQTNVPYQAMTPQQQQQAMHMHMLRQGQQAAYNLPQRPQMYGQVQLNPRAYSQWAMGNQPVQHPSVPQPPKTPVMISSEKFYKLTKLLKEYPQFRARIVKEAKNEESDLEALENEFKQAQNVQQQQQQHGFMRQTQQYQVNQPLESQQIQQPTTQIQPPPMQQSENPPSQKPKNSPSYSLLEMDDDMPPSLFDLDDNDPCVVENHYDEFFEN